MLHDMAQTLLKRTRTYAPPEHTTVRKSRRSHGGALYGSLTATAHDTDARPTDKQQNENKTCTPYFYIEALF